MRERRRSPRFQADQEIYARIKSSIPVKIVDVSGHGMMVESSSAVPPAGACDLWLPGDNGDVKLRVRVQRSRAQFINGVNGNRGLVYRSGLEFLEVDEAARAALESILRQLGGDLESCARVVATVSAVSDEDESSFRASEVV
ncbi:MAG TPA: PilZ domain-containing protein [Thermoanaerobaculales bacterium]|nr:PilZ domain-containing protein [Thermoanaerobaculales bacterium]HPA80153.1 PilZ domain-containing protein [Thermoanaerobaculales bacterium]HQL31323.1 PilZ domain-containing protein [Thermoanaerobaculales bacterium]HQN94768.1 PilZ domain-containing protein [Thermoanaerobaculales bacterium]HQP42570.1 PilZ domain-containing protein [Thermoanaerobaculales bacterium]